MEEPPSSDLETYLERGGANGGSGSGTGTAASGFGSAYSTYCSDPNAPSVAARSASDQRQPCAHLRLAPLRRKEAAPIKRVVICGGALFAAPAGDGGQMLQWSLVGGMSGVRDTMPAGGSR